MSCTLARTGNWYRTDTGGPLPYSNWNPNEPSNSQGREHYAFIDRNGGGGWNDADDCTWDTP